jgi:hypothetical protein
MIYVTIHYIYKCFQAQINANLLKILVNGYNIIGILVFVLA